MSLCAGLNISSLRHNYSQSIEVLMNSNLFEIDSSVHSPVYLYPFICHYSRIFTKNTGGKYK
jgi:hypothetical protein